MTDKEKTTAKKPRVRGLAPLKKFMKVIPKYYESINSGLEDLIDGYQAKYGVDLAYERDIETLFQCLDTVAQNTSFLISIRVGAICTKFDQILFAYDFKKEAPKSVQKQFKQYTDYMTPTDRLQGELKEFIYDVFSFTTGLYGLKASLIGLERATGIKEFKYLDNKILRLEPTKIDPDTWTYEKAKAECKKAKTYKIEDYLNTINIALKELVKRGYDFASITPFDVKAFRPSEKTITDMVQSKHFFNSTNKYKDYSDAFMPYCHELYIKQVVNEHHRIRQEAFELERSLYPEAYRMFDEDEEE